MKTKTATAVTNASRSHRSFFIRTLCNLHILKVVDDGKASSSSCFCIIQTNLTTLRKIWRSMTRLARTGCALGRGTKSSCTLFLGHHVSCGTLVHLSGTYSCQIPSCTICHKNFDIPLDVIESCGSPLSQQHHHSDQNPVLRAGFDSTYTDVPCQSKAFDSRKQFG